MVLLLLAGTSCAASLLQQRLTHAHEAAVDPDCTSREFDATAQQFDTDAAVATFLKCRLLVLRNALPADTVNAIRAQFRKFVRGMRSGRISTLGTTSAGEAYYHTDRQPGRRELLLPRAFARAELVMHPQAHNVLQHPRILGPGLVLHSLGSVVAEPGTGAQDWHVDNAYPFEGVRHDEEKHDGGDDSEVAQVGGHDLPSYAVTMLTPLHNLSARHGPTEFCLGALASPLGPTLDLTRARARARARALLTRHLLARPCVARARPAAGRRLRRR